MADNKRFEDLTIEEQKEKTNKDIEESVSKENKKVGSKQFKKLKDVAYAKYVELIEGKISVDDLSFGNDADKKAFIDYINIYPDSALRKLKSSNELHFLNYALDKNYKYFLNLDESQYTNEIVFKYLRKLLISNGNVSQNDKQFGIKSSFDDKLIFEFVFDTTKFSGSSIRYYDNSLELPVNLEAYITTNLKIVDSLAFLKKLDIKVNELNANIIFNKFNLLIKDALIKTIYTSLNKHNNSYYELIVDRNNLNSALVTNINESFKPYGIEAIETDILNIDFDKNIIEKIQEINFENIVERNKKDIELKYQKESLDLYERKVKIHSENPNVEWNLSEAEKDRAFERYQENNGIYKKNESVILTNKKFDHNHQFSATTSLEKETNKLPRFKSKSKINILFIVLSILAAIALFIIGKEYIDFAYKWYTKSENIYYTDYQRYVQYFDSYSSFALKVNIGYIAICLLLLPNLFFYFKPNKINDLSRKSKLFTIFFQILPIISFLIFARKGFISCPVTFIICAIVLLLNVLLIPLASKSKKTK